MERIVYPSVCAIDPGGTIGIAIRGNREDRKLTLTTLDSMETLMWLLNTLNRAPLDAVVIENFITDHMISAAGLLTVRLVGAVQGWCICNKVRISVQVPQFRYSSRQEMEQVVKDYSKRTIIHERDALMHLLAFEEKVAPIWRNEGWPTQST